VQISELISGTTPTSRSGHRLRELFDNLMFPALMTAVLAGSQVASTRVLYKNRDFLDGFARNLGYGHHPQRAL